MTKMMTSAETVHVRAEGAGFVAPAPFLRWCGSKRWLAPRLADLIATRLADTGIYFEPFLGAGSVALALPMGTKMALGDLCTPLAGLWAWIKADPRRLFRSIAGNWRNEEGVYYAVREAFNTGPYSIKDPAPSARMLWLNATGFNGIYRENKDGKYNVPFGKRKTISLPTLPLLEAISDHLQSAELVIGGDFDTTLEESPHGAPQTGDVIFCDPPYDAELADEDGEGAMESFTAYTSAGFEPPEQWRLAASLEKHRAAGAFVITTNADTRLVRDLYPTKLWSLETVTEKRVIAADARKRTGAACLVITSR